MSTKPKSRRSTSKAKSKPTHPHPPTIRDDAHYTFAEVAEIIGPSFTPRWVQRQVYEFRTMKAKRVGGRRVVLGSEIKRFLAAAEGR